MQGILGTSSKHPLMYVSHHDGVIDIYFGMAKFMTIPNDRGSRLFKSAVAILHNAGIRVKDIKESFNLSYSSVIKYANAFKYAKDEEALSSKLKNPGRSRYKMNDEIFSYIHERAEHYRSLGQSYFHNKIIQDVENIFNIQLSREKIRTVLNQNKGTEKSVATKINTKPVAVKEKFISDSKPDDAENSNSNLPMRNRHCGLLLLSSYFSLVLDDYPDEKIKIKEKEYSVNSVLYWWILATLYGLNNIEKQRHVNVNDFEFISGYENLPSVETMRKILFNLSISQETSATTILLQKNIDYFVEIDTDYYLDPHIKSYSGDANLLKVWSTSRNRVCKGSVDTFIHDSNGTPVFSYLKDNFDDFRETIKTFLIDLTKKLHQKSATLIYDRGGFSIELLKIISTRHNFITWQKGFAAKEVRDIKFPNEMFIQFPYNDLGKFRGYTIKFTEDRWRYKDFECRRILFEKETKEHGQFFQSILTNDEKSEGSLIIKKMLKRSLQELDFKKQKKYFGLDDITSYRKLEYNALNDKNSDKQARNRDYDKILKSIRTTKETRGKYLAKLGVKVLSKSFLKKQSDEFLKKHASTIDKINELNQKIAALSAKKKDIDKEISKLAQCKSENREELDLRPKRFYNMIKIISRNIMEKGAKEFVQTYKNLRDYQKVFHMLVSSAGEIEISGTIMYIKLDPFGRKPFREKCNKYFDEFNTKSVKTLDKKFVIQLKKFPP